MSTVDVLGKLNKVGVEVIVVVGAGPVGLVLANELARLGVSYRIVEKISTRSTWSKALMITSRTMQILENIGLTEEILAKGTVVEGGDMHWNQEFIGGISVDAVDPNTRYPFPFVLPQPDVEEALEHVLNKRKGKVERENEAIKVDPLKEYVQVTLKSGQVIKAKYVVGCDGAHSLIRHSQPEWKFEGHPVNVLWAQCDGTISDPKKSTTRVAGYLGGNGFSLRLPMYHQHRRFRFIVNVPHAITSTNNEFRYGRLEGETPTLEEFNALIKNAMGKYYAEVKDPTWLTYFMVQERMVNHLRRGRLFLAGDAAHCHSPAGGQGMNMGIQDAHNLAWKLAMVVKGQAIDPEKLLDSYSEERIPIIRKTIDMTANMVRMMTAAGSWYAPFIRLGLSTALNFKSFQKALIPTLLQSSLCLTPTAGGVLSTSTHSFLKPGSMLPDPIHPIFIPTHSPPDISGSTHLLPILNTTKHIALFLISDLSLHEPHPLFTKFSAITAPYSEVLQPAVLARAYRMGGFRKPDWADENIKVLASTGSVNKEFGLEAKQMGIVIVRPDGYVGFSCLVDSRGEALDYAAKWLEGILSSDTSS